MAEIILNAENFEEEVLNSEMPVVVDFWAQWCGPCKMMAPVVSEIARDFTNIKVCKLDIDACAELAIRYNVMSIPTLVLFENGKESKRTVGYMEKEEICAALGINK